MQIDKGAEYGCYNLGNYLRSCFFTLTKNQRAQAAKHAAKQTETAAEADTADMEQHAEYSSVGYECIEPDISAETTATDAAESTAGSETTDAAESTATAEQSGYSAEAVKNNARFADDTTQKELETMHGHSEAQQKMAQEHSRNCQTLHNKAADGAKIIEAETQSMFGSVEDLIAMGYSGNLEFERDFLGEGLDMINNF